MLERSQVFKRRAVEKDLSLTEGQKSKGGGGGGGGGGPAPRALHEL